MSIKTITDSATNHGDSELERVDYLDGWRGLAIALVLQRHFFDVRWGSFGQLGVDVFFCLSGLLMSRILFVKRTPLNIFYKRRISRILPSFFLYICVIYGYAYVTGNPLGWRDFISALTFLRSYYPQTPEIFSTGYPIGHIWSLNVEEHCYVLLSLFTLWRFMKGREAFLLIALGSASIGIRLLYDFVPEYEPQTSSWVRTEATSSFLLISAGYALISKQVAPFVKPWMPIAALALSIILCLKFADWLLVVFSISAPFLLAFSVNHLAQTPAFFRNALSIRPLRLLGIGSYSIYLWQQPFYIYADKAFSDDFTFHALFLFMALILGAVMFYCFENPSRLYINKAW